MSEENQLRFQFKKNFWNLADHSRLNPEKFTSTGAHPLRHVGEFIVKSHPYRRSGMITSFTERDYLEITRNCFSTNSFLNSLKLQ